MKKQGFTLIELIGTIVLISVMALIIVPGVSRIIKQSEINAANQEKENIILSAKNWVLDNKNSIPKLYNSYMSVYVSDLINKGYIDKENLSYNGCVRITNKRGANQKRDVLKYDYIENISNCTNYVPLDDSDLCELQIDPAPAIFNGKNWCRTPIKVTLHNNSPEAVTNLGIYKDNKKIADDEININSLKNGENVFYGKVTNNRENYSCVKRLNYDNTGPVITDKSTNSGSVATIKFSVEDLLSGVNAYYLSDNKIANVNDITTWTKYTNEATINNKKICHKYYAYAKDNVGNITEKVVGTYDKNICTPTCQLVMNGTKGNDNWYKSGAKIELKNYTTPGDSTISEYGMVNSKTTTNNKTVSLAAVNGKTYYGYVKNNLGYEVWCGPTTTKIDDCTKFTEKVTSSTACTKKCGSGTRTDTYTKTSSTGSGFGCGTRQATGVACNTQACCSSVKYTNGTTCSAKCGGGTYNRLAYSNYDGSRCSSKDTSTGGPACNTQGCCSKVNYGNWSGCSKACEGGTQSRSKTSAYNGSSCGTESRACNTQGCCSSTYNYPYVRVYNWNYNTKSCDGSTKYRQYNYYMYDCNCQVSNYINRSCGSNPVDIIPSEHSGHYTAKIYYLNNNNGKKACKNDGVAVTSYVKQVCTDGTYANHAYNGNSSVMSFHGSLFYNGVAALVQSGSFSGWYYNNMPIYPNNKFAANNQYDACNYACKQYFPN